MVDLAVAVTPLYFASMAWERLALQRRAARLGPSAADYTGPDTATSLGMGVLSLTTPITAALVAATAPRRAKRGALGWAVVGVAASAATAATIADRVVRRADVEPEADRGRVERARKVAEVGGVVALAAGGVALCGAAAISTSAKRMWRKGGHRRDLGNGALAWTVAMVGWDLGYYWNHRLMHEVRALWAIHVPHHSSEHYNLSTALRQPVAGAFGVWVPYGAMARFGVRPNIIGVSHGLNLIYQYWIHTDMIRSLGRAEAVLNTPSHHRVHHGSNRRYIDRNHAGILIVWDKLFGTFQREMPIADPVVYGLTKNVGTYNLWTVSTHEYRDIARDVARSKTWRDRVGFVVRSPGWAISRRAELDELDRLDARDSLQPATV